MNYLKNTLYLAILLLFFSCAKQTSPTGGPKDTIPPVLIKSLPQKQQTNFNGSKLELYFNETVVLANPKEQIMMIPSVPKEDYDVTANKRKVTLQFKNKLLDTTTYSVNFRDAIQDITEKNPAVNLKIAFSTGSYIDSLFIEGHVYDLVKISDIKEATVAVYQADTFNIFKHKPSYITKTNSKGKFIIENLKPGNYFVYAIDDKSRNLIVDSKNESYGFLTDTLKLKKNISEISIPISKLDARPLKLTSARPYNTYYNIKTSKNLQTYKLKSIDSSVVHSCFGEDAANIRIYNTLSDEDSTAIHFTARDSINNTIDTTLYVKFSKREVKPEQFITAKESFRILANKGSIIGKIKFNKPVRSVNYDSIFFKVDSLNTITFSKENFYWDSLRNIVIIQKTFDKSILTKPKDESIPPQEKIQRPQTPEKASTKKNISNLLYIGTSSFISIENDSSKRIQENVKPLSLEETGVLSVEAKTKQPNYLVELLDKTFNVLQTTRNLQKSSFEDLSPGDYMIRLIIDKNNDGKWTPGNFLEKREPEPIRYYKSEKGNPIINLKANWEIDQLFITYE